MKKNLIIIGAGGHGKVVAEVALRMKKWSKVAFLDDNTNNIELMETKVIGKSKDIDKYIVDADFFVAIGNNLVREKIQNELKSKGATLPVLIHPDAVIGYQVTIGEGTIIMAGVTINCCTKIGKGCIINTGATLDHDDILEDFVHISPGVHVAGNVSIGKKTWIGIGSCIINNVTITKECTVGAGAVVINNIIEAGTYVGVPARRI